MIYPITVFPANFMTQYLQLFITDCYSGLFQLFFVSRKPGMGFRMPVEQIFQIGVVFLPTNKLSHEP